MCTLHSFPFIIDHCLTWARSEFEGLLEKTPSEANKFLSKKVPYLPLPPPAIVRQYRFSSSSATIGFLLARVLAGIIDHFNVSMPNRCVGTASLPSAIGWHRSLSSCDWLTPLPPLL
jgi:hypothetical protein